MAYIIVILIVAILNGCLIFIDQMLDGILPLSLYAEKYMTMDYIGVPYKNESEVS